MSGSSCKASQLTNGPTTGSSRRHHYITQDRVLLIAKKPNDPFLPLQYKIHKTKLQSFAPLYHAPVDRDGNKREKKTPAFAA
ncbi:hypothetical protein BV898_05755 [Hypsibius exemplaris]|uniref:Uncharacterized protein n=1 Tax=Hypsibius exemplaris TaxID=2072580 RepID=A0A1W0WYD1_HYPEX|nr:hypothetical protein BV898_05755 [Hypsibius exemplaris]